MKQKIESLLNNLKRYLTKLNFLNVKHRTAVEDQKREKVKRWMFRLFKRVNQLNLIAIDMFARREDKLYSGDYSFTRVHETFGLFIEKGFIEKKYPNTSRGIYILTDKGREYAILRGYFDEK